MRPFYFYLIPNNHIPMTTLLAHISKRATACSKLHPSGRGSFSRQYSSQLNPTLLRTGRLAKNILSEQSPRPPTHRHRDRRSFTSTAAKSMASDEDYMAFLDKANRDPNEGYAAPQSTSKTELKTTDAGAKIPAAIQEATTDAFYVSDSDEPFVPVSLSWDEGGKGLPDEEELAVLIQHPDPANASIEIQDPAEWDTQGQYKAIIDAVAKAGKGNDVRVYRVARGGARVEYWVLTTDGKGASAKLVGAKALAVES